MANLNSLNAQQYQAVTDFQGPMMILAGAGTGKTRVITFRIAHMLRNGVPAKRIVALTFTNKAAREMAERTASLAGEQGKDVWLGTFHSFCLMILREFHKQADLPKRFGLAATGDQADLMRKSIEELNWRHALSPEELLGRIGTAKNNLLLPDEIETKGKHLFQNDAAVVAAAYSMYERQLKLNRVIDFDDCLLKCVRLLRDNPDVRAKLRDRFRYFLVDEYQDTNETQLAVLQELASDRRDVCVVGDDDQSIYSWRGAKYEILERFEELFEGTKIVKLEQNYRCSNVILEAANTVIRNNSQRKDKTLWSASEERSPIQLHRAADDRAEANYVAQKILAMMGGGRQPEEVAVLYRANALARPIELALREARIPYKTFGGQSFFERKEVKDFLAYVRLAFNQEDRLAMWRIINTPNRGIGLKTLENIEEKSKSSRATPWKILTGDVKEVAGRSAGACEQFVSMLRNIAAMPISTPEEVENFGRAIIREAGLDRDIREKSPNSGVRDRKLENLFSLPTWLATVATEQIAHNGSITREALLDATCLDNDRRDKTELEGRYVSLMSIHASKGLEFPVVFLVGTEEELLPHRNSLLDPSGIAEERRLFYVALTRAKSQVFISNCLERKGARQSGTLCQPSRFLKEIPPEVLATSGAGDMKTAERDRQKSTASLLGQLRADLAKNRDASR